ncbi:hypothetical protein [Aristaeella hokkaidonensis]|uniref:Uncharacterized protein n=1 Tax=Aristaeella hokkaidonensis TaxID=3046382 RepID=A0AC61MX33_9FIRM|nr:hypothetical protein [Aristaeella hokkaidonensis]QUC66118.1 hypothetical protein JYE49_09575 [Aristaeella hokkaidonensis]SNT94878.1 hypothetical protein SAMN06297421_107107 [Aristaeella hokkaidonensis]
MDRIDARKLLEEQFARSLALDKYKLIMYTVKTIDLSKDYGFQKTFNAFYRIRRNTEWRECFYGLFECAKKNHFSFEEVINKLYAETGNVEASFTSKMIATIDPDKPIWDQYVLHNLGLELKGKTSQERIKNAVVIYYRIENWFDNYLQTDEAYENIAEFDRWFPNYTWLSSVKKIDYLLWSKR